MTKAVPLSRPRRITEARLLAMVNSSGDSFWETDTERRFVHLSDNMCRLMGYRQEELLGRSVADVMTPEYRAQIQRLAASRGAAESPLAHAGPLRHEGEFFRSDGERIWVETVSVPVFDDDGKHIGYFGITRDTTQRKRAEQALHEANRRLAEQLQDIQSLHLQLREQAIRDALTGVHNRRHFVDVATHELERVRCHGGALSLVLLDLDHFKHVNDRYGHPVGDAALKAVGRLLAATIRGEDLACRLGGEEFAILAPGLGHDDAVARAEHWRQSLAALEVRAEGLVLRLTASFGVASFPQDADTLDALMRSADTRLYAAKDGGRNRVVGTLTE